MRRRRWINVENALCMSLLALMAFGCATSTWDAARTKNSIKGYNQFLRDHPGSAYAAEAEERKADLRVRTTKTIEGFEEFRRSYPQSSLLPDLRAFMEPHFFEKAREANTAAAYREFLKLYPAGGLTEKAKGNLAYVSSIRENPGEGPLREFAKRHAASDFAAEAQHSLELLELQRQTAIRRLAVQVNIAANVTQPKRVWRGFAHVVGRRYRELGVEVSFVEPGQMPPPNIDALARIDYQETDAEGTFGGRTMISKCRFRMYRPGSQEPIWDRSFEAPADHILQEASGRDRTVFGNKKYRFWSEFFVPVSRWANSESRVQRREHLEQVTAIDVRGDRAGVLYARGGVDYLDISRPAELKVLDRYRRGKDLSRWNGIKLVSDRLILIYGPDGAELVELGVLKANELGKWEIPEVGHVRGATVYGKTLFFAGTKGVFGVRYENKPIVLHRLLDREFVSVAWNQIAVGDPYIYLVSPSTVEVATPGQLLQHLTGHKVNLGKNFGAKRARIEGSSLFVFGKDDVVELGLGNPTDPKIISNLPADQVGNIRDLVADGGYLYLLGDRGLQIASSGGQWINDSIQVDANRALARKGRFVFLVGQNALEVFDLAPYQAAVASPAR